jgi:hypothetical protein
MNHDGHLDGKRCYDAGIAAIRRQRVREGLYEPLPGNALEHALACVGAAERDFAAASRAYAQTSLLRTAETGAAGKWFHRAYKNLVRAERELERLEGSVVRGQTEMFSA